MPSNTSSGVNNEIYWTWDVSLQKFSFIGQGLKSVLGLDEQLVISDPFQFIDIVHPEHKEMVREVLSSSNYPANSIVFQNMDNKWFQASWASIGGEQIVGRIQDITTDEETSKVMVRYVERSDAILQAALNPYALINVDGFITNFNASFAKLVGMALNEVQGKHICQLASDPKTLQSDFLDRVLKNGRVRLNTDLIQRNGNIIPIECSATTTFMHDRTMVVAFFNDLSTRIAARKQLMHAIIQKEEAIRLKQQLLANITHEIKSPISSILGIIDVLDKQIKDNPEQTEYLDMIRFNSHRLMSSLQSVIEISRLESGLARKDFKPVNLVNSMQELIPYFKRQLEGKKISLAVAMPDGEIEIHGDKFLLQESWKILVGNAIKFTKEGQISIGIATPDAVARFIEISIADSGVGMSQEYLRSLFTPFSQENSGYNRPYEGLGLGLALAKRYVELQKGELEIESTKGRGTKVVVRFLNSN